jgi:hypothetical protein
MARLPENAVISAVQPYTVTRAMCMDGQRVEVGATVHLTRVQGTELCAAGKVTPGAAREAAPDKPSKAPKATAKAPAQADATADATPTQEAAP